MPAGFPLSVMYSVEYGCWYGIIISKMVYSQFSLSICILTSIIIYLGVSSVTFLFFTRYMLSMVNNKYIRGDTHKYMTRNSHPSFFH